MTNINEQFPLVDGQKHLSTFKRSLPQLPAKETFICEVDVLKAEMESCELTIEGEFISEAKMEEMGWSENLN